MSIMTIASQKITAANLGSMSEYYEKEAGADQADHEADNFIDQVVSNYQPAQGSGRDDYFLTGKNENARMIGGFADQMRLPASYYKGSYEKLMMGFNPLTGEDLLTKNRRKQVNKAFEVQERIKEGEEVTKEEKASVSGLKLGFSTAFSVDKSISLLYAKADEKTQAQIEKALMDANEKAWVFFEQSGYIRTRTGNGGVNAQEGKAAVMSFLHQTNRDLEPQLHIHNELPNFVTFYDEKLKKERTNTLDASELYKRQKEIASVFDALLRKELTQTLQIDSLEKDFFRADITGYGLIADGFSDDIKKSMSSRRTAIVAKAAEMGGSGNADVLRWAALETRTAKDKEAEEIGEEALKEGWREALAGENVKALSAEEREQEQAVTKLQIEALLFQGGSVFDSYALDRAAAAYAVKVGADLTDLPAIKKHIEREMQVIVCAKEEDDNRTQKYTTRDMAAMEADLFRYAHRASQLDIEAFKLNPAQVQQALENVQKEKGFRLREEQAEALLHAASSKRLALIQGAAGTGKSVSLEVLNKAYEANGTRVIGLAPSGAAAASLEESAGIQSKTVHALLSNLERARNRHERDRLLKAGDVVVVDEAGMLDTRTLHKLTEVCERNGAKIVLVGDAWQLEAVGSAGLFGTLQETAGKADIEKIARQKDPNLSAISQAWYDGEPGDALEAMQRWDATHGSEKGRSLINFEWGQGAQDALIERFEELLDSGESADEILLLADFNSDVNALNERARAAYKERGFLAEEEVTFNAKDPQAGFDKDLVLAEGDRIMLRQNGKVGSDETRVNNGDTGGFRGLDSEGGILIELDRTGQIVALGDDYRQVQYAYAMTVHKSQGLTVNHALYQPGMTNRRAAYVAFTRSRNGAEFFISGELGEDEEAELDYTESQSWQDFAGNVEDYKTKQTALDGLSKEAADKLRKEDPFSALSFKYTQHPSVKELLEKQGEIMRSFNLEAKKAKSDKNKTQKELLDAIFSQPEPEQTQEVKTMPNPLIPNIPKVPKTQVPAGRKSKYTKEQMRQFNYEDHQAVKQQFSKSTLEEFAQSLGFEEIKGKKGKYRFSGDEIITFVQAPGNDAGFNNHSTGQGGDAVALARHAGYDYLSAVQVAADFVGHQTWRNRRVNAAQKKQIENRAAEVKERRDREVKESAEKKAQRFAQAKNFEEKTRDSNKFPDYLEGRGVAPERENYSAALAQEQNFRVHFSGGAVAFLQFDENLQFIGDEMKGEKVKGASVRGDRGLHIASSLQAQGETLVITEAPIDAHALRKLDRADGLDTGRLYAASGGSWFGTSEKAALAYAKKAGVSKIELAFDNDAAGQVNHEKAKLAFENAGFEIADRRSEYADFKDPGEKAEQFFLGKEPVQKKNEQPPANKRAPIKTGPATDLKKEDLLGFRLQPPVKNSDALQRKVGLEPLNYHAYRDTLVFTGRNAKNKIAGAVIVDAATLQPRPGVGEAGIFGKGDVASKNLVITSHPIEALSRAKADQQAGAEGRRYIAPVTPNNSFSWRKDPAIIENLDKAILRADQVVIATEQNDKGDRDAKFVAERAELAGKKSTRSFHAKASVETETRFLIEASTEEKKERVSNEVKGLAESQVIEKLQEGVKERQASEVAKQAEHEETETETVSSFKEQQSEVPNQEQDERERNEWSATKKARSRDQRFEM